MPIGFWAISRNDLKESWYRQNYLYPAQKVAFTEGDLDHLVRSLPESLNSIIDQELRVQMAHRRIQNQK